jgi:hypothetical protein
MHQAVRGCALFSSLLFLEEAAAGLLQLQIE